MSDEPEMIEEEGEPQEPPPPPYEPPPFVAVMPLPKPHRGNTHMGWQTILVESRVQLWGVYGTIKDEAFRPDHETKGHHVTGISLQADEALRSDLAEGWAAWLTAWGVSLLPPELRPEPEEEADEQAD